MHDNPESLNLDLDIANQCVSGLKEFTDELNKSVDRYKSLAYLYKHEQSDAYNFFNFVYEEYERGQLSQRVQEYFHSKYGISITEEQIEIQNLEGTLYRLKDSTLPEINEFILYDHYKKFYYLDESAFTLALIEDKFNEEQLEFAGDVDKLKNEIQKFVLKYPDVEIIPFDVNKVLQNSVNRLDDIFRENLPRSVYFNNIRKVLSKIGRAVLTIDPQSNTINRNAAIYKKYLDQIDEN